MVAEALTQPATEEPDAQAPSQTSQIVQQSAAADAQDIAVIPDVDEQREKSAAASKAEPAAGNASVGSMQSTQMLNGAQLHAASASRDDDSLAGSEAYSDDGSAGSGDDSESEAKGGKGQ